MQPNHNITIGFGFRIENIPTDILESINFKHIRNLIDNTVNFKQYLLEYDLYPSFITSVSGFRQPETDDYAVLISNPSVYLSVQDWFSTLAEQPDIETFLNEQHKFTLLYKNIMNDRADFRDSIGVFCSEIIADIAVSKGFSKNVMSLVFDDSMRPCIIFPKRFVWDVPECDRSITQNIILHDIIYPVLSGLGLSDELISNICGIITISN